MARLLEMDCRAAELAVRPERGVEKKDMGRAPKGCRVRKQEG